jgi:hypothetical protein
LGTKDHGSKNGIHLRNPIKTYVKGTRDDKIVFSVANLASQPDKLLSSDWESRLCVFSQNPGRPIRCGESLIVYGSMLRAT